MCPGNRVSHPARQNTAMNHTDRPLSASSRKRLDLILAGSDSLQPGERMARLEFFLTSLMDVMDLEHVRQFRAQVARSGIVKRSEDATSLDLIDGHIALREMQGRTEGRDD